MLSSRTSSLCLIACLASGAAIGCSNSSDGTAPTIKDFTLMPTALTVGTTTALTGSMTIEDPDGDISGLSGNVTFPDKTVHPLQDNGLASNATSIEVPFTIPQLPVTAAGDYVVTVQARDGAGNQSEPVSVTLTAQ